MRRKIALFLAVLLVMNFLPAFSASAETNNRNENTCREGTYNFTNVVLFAYFDGENAKEDKAFFQNAQNRDKILDMYNGSHGQSFTSYLNTVSYGNLRVNNVFPQDNGETITPYCIHNVTLEQANARNVDEIILSELLANITLNGVDTDLYGNDGVVDNITVIIRGGAGATGSSTLHSHKGNYGGTDSWNGDRVGTYNIIGTYNLMELSYSAEESGVLIHEFLHSVGFPDLYSPVSGVYPVGIWDIMASVAYKPSYPLAYMRMRAGWLDIETITDSAQSLTLVPQSAAEGNRAYILKSPLNDQELFVVEFRKQPARSYTDRDSLDYYIQGSGLIVYRIDTKVENLSNYHGGTGVYVFPLQEGEEGYVSGNAQVNVNKSYFSAENHRTGIGSKEAEATQKDGALTFSDGSNSGIVISNISSGAGDTMTFDVEIPKASDYDVWTNTNFADTASNYSNRMIAMENYKGVAHLAVFTDGVISLYAYNNGSWEKAATDLALGNSTYLSSMDLASYNQELYLKYDVYPSAVLKKLSGNGWSDVATVGDCNLSKMSALSDGLYMAYITTGGKAAKLAKIDGSKVLSLGTYYGEDYCGLPAVVQAKGDIYAAVKDISGKLRLYRYQENGFTEIANEMKANSYGVTGFNDSLYFVLGATGSETASLCVYDGREWKKTDTGIQGNMPQLVTAGNKLYALLCSPDAAGGDTLVMYGIDKENGTFTKEGNQVDGAASATSLTAAGDRIYVAAVRSAEGTLVVKAKTVAKEEVQTPVSEKLVYSQTDGKWYYCVNGEVVTSYTGLFHYNDAWWYIVNGVLAEDYKGIVENSAGKWYVSNGKINTSYKGLGEYEGEWYCIQAGKVNMDFTGMLESAGTWWYIRNGKLDQTYTGPFKVNDITWFIKNGKLDTNFSGFGNNRIDFWYVTNGKINTGFTGLVRDGDVWWYVVNGKIATDYKGLVKNSAGTWYVVNGKIDTSFKGLAWNGTDWICVRGGKVDMTYTGMIANAGIWWYVVDGKFMRSFTGICENGGSLWYVVEGRLASDYSGSYVENGVSYRVVNGKAFVQN